MQLLAVLKNYNETLDVDKLGESLDMLLETHVERRILKDIRYIKQT